MSLNHSEADYNITSIHQAPPLVNDYVDTEMKSECDIEFEIEHSIALPDKISERPSEQLSTAKTTFSNKMLRIAVKD